MTTRTIHPLCTGFVRGMRYGTRFRAALRSARMLPSTWHQPQPNSSAAIYPLLRLQRWLRAGHGTTAMRMHISKYKIKTKTCARNIQTCVHQHTCTAAMWTIIRLFLPFPSLMGWSVKVVRDIRCALESQCVRACVRVCVCVRACACARGRGRMVVIPWLY